MAKKILISISWLLVIVTMLLILNFSSEGGEASANTSQEFVEEILGVVMDKEQITDEVINDFQLPIRKVAHFGIYMLLGFCLLNAFSITFNFKAYFNALFSFLTAVLYAILDEFVYQNIATNRGPSITDVLIDSLGIFIGLILFLLIILLKKIYKNRNLD